MFFPPTDPLAAAKPFGPVDPMASREYTRQRQMGLADLQLKYKHINEACATYLRSQKVFERMRQEGHLSAIDRKVQLGGIITARHKNCAR